MKLKKMSVIGLILMLAIVTFLLNVVIEKEVEAMPGYPDAVTLCCLHYAVDCPSDVQHLCFSDCLDYDCGLNN
jgi:hypothetical protein